MRAFSFIIVGLVAALVLPCQSAPKAPNDLTAIQPDGILIPKGDEKPIAIGDELYDEDDLMDSDTSDEDTADGDDDDDEDTDDDDGDDGEEVSELIVDANDYLNAKDAELVEYLEAWLSSLTKPVARRQKRWVPLAIRVGAWAARAGSRYLASRGGARALFRSAIRGTPTRSGSRLTRHYTKQGSYRSAMRDFSRLGPSNIKPIPRSKFSGYSGTIGRGSRQYKMTVRSGSKEGSPTLEIRCGDLVRKFRYVCRH